MNGCVLYASVTYTSFFGAGGKCHFEGGATYRLETTVVNSSQKHFLIVFTFSTIYVLNLQMTLAHENPKHAGALLHQGFCFWRLNIGCNVKKLY